jgi:hypothetical protein
MDGRRPALLGIHPRLPPEILANAQRILPSSGVPLKDQPKVRRCRQPLKVLVAKREVRNLVPAQEPCERAQQRRLARAVGPCESNPRSWVKFESSTMYQPTPAPAE